MAGIDLYGRKLIFQVRGRTQKANIDFAQEYFELNEGSEPSKEIVIDVLFEEMGG